MKHYQTKLISILLLGSAIACGKKSDDKKSAEDSTETASDPTKVAITGSLNLQTLRLAGGDNVSHVVALNVETGDAKATEVDADGNFAIDIGKGQPYVINYVDDTKTGAAMIVSSFASDTLDTLNAADDAEPIELGEVDVSAAKASMDLATDDFLAAIKMSATAAATVGSIDDVSLRYSNPDIDNNGKLDAEEGKSYMIDFHNRFLAKTAAGATLGISDLKNAFYPDTVQFIYSGTGIFPQIPKTDLDGTAPSTYKWSFSVAMPTASNGGNTCSGLTSGVDLAIGADCELTYSGNTGANGGDVFVFGMETANLKAGDYTLKAGSKTYQWTNVAVSDFSAGKGFLALFYRVDVDSNDKLTGISYKWMKKSDTGYTAASIEEVKLIVKADDTGNGGYISLKYQGDESKGSLGVKVPISAASGSVVLATEVGGQNVHVQGSVLTEQMVKDGVSFSDFTTNPGVSYDDKLGMRFFF